MTNNREFRASIVAVIRERIVVKWEAIVVIRDGVVVIRDRVGAEREAVAATRERIAVWRLADVAKWEGVAVKRKNGARQCSCSYRLRLILCWRLPPASGMDQRIHPPRGDPFGAASPFAFERGPGATNSSDRNGSVTSGC